MKFLQTRQEKRRNVRRASVFSRLAHLIFLSNLVGLLVFILLAFATSGFSQSLIDAKVEDLKVQTTMLTALVGDRASGIGTLPELDTEAARDFLGRFDLPKGWRIRLYDKAGTLIADSVMQSNAIKITELAPIDVVPSQDPWLVRMQDELGRSLKKRIRRLPWQRSNQGEIPRNIENDVKSALLGQTASGAGINENDDLVVAVTMPIRRVQNVLGVIMIESQDVEKILEAERRALAPILGLAFLAAILSSLALTLFIARPIRRLARAAEFVARSSKKKDAIPDLSRRRDEIGDLSIVMQEMTNGLYDRIDDIANFAADVAHEIKNPLTSLRSASDTLRAAQKPEQRDKLIDIIQNDVARMDRLITDISKASKVDANLARETAQTIDVRLILGTLEEFYQQTTEESRVEIIFKRPLKDDPIYIRAFETPFAQVLRNLIDNAITFSPEGGKIYLTLRVEKDNKSRDSVIICVDDEGPGIPPDNLQTVFERFYTERPLGAQFGSHSGLGLAICRQIVNAHRGTIRAENRVQTKPSKAKPNIATDAACILGARFTINVPRQRITN